MLGSVGSIVLVVGDEPDLRRRSNPRAMIAAGMFLFATIGFIVVQIDRTAEAAHAAADRLPHGVPPVPRRTSARWPATPPTSSAPTLTWHHPDPSALPSLAEDRVRLWEHTPSDENFLHVRYGLSAQPLSLELVPPDSAPIEQVDPAAASALHRLLVVHRVQPNLPASIDLRAFDRIELTGDEEQARSLARSMVCSATAFHNPEHLVVAVLCSDDHLAHWDWLKWLPHSLSGQQGDAVGPRRMVTTSPRRPRRDAAAGPQRPAPVRRRRGARRRRTSCSSSTAASCRRATTSSRPTGCTASR